MKSMYDKIKFLEYRNNPFAHDLMKTNEVKEDVNYSFFLDVAAPNKTDMNLLKAIEKMVKYDENYIGIVNLNTTNLKNYGFSGTSAAKSACVKRWKQSGILQNFGTSNRLYWLNPKIINKKSLQKLWAVDGKESMEASA